MSDLETLEEIRRLVIKNIVLGSRPTPEELVALGDTYKQVWEAHDKAVDDINKRHDGRGLLEQFPPPDEPEEPLPDWAEILD